MITVGTGVSIPGLIIAVFAIIAAQEFSVIVTKHEIIGWTGIMLSLISRVVAK